MLALTPAGACWRVLRLAGGRVERLSTDVDLGYAHGIAEDYVRQSGVLRLAEAAARWRSAPISEAQAGRLRRLGVAAPAGASKGEGSGLIALAQAGGQLDRLAGQAA